MLLLKKQMEDLSYIYNNRGYLINSKNIIDTGVDFVDLNQEYVFDSEYITKNIDNEI